MTEPLRRRMSSLRSPLVALALLAWLGGHAGACDDRATKPAPAAPVAKVPAPTATAAPVKEMLVGFWNIEWLGKPEDRSGVARDVAQKPEDIADAIIDSGVSVLGVAEVVTRIAGRPIRSREIESVVDAIKAKTGERWEYTLNPGRAEGDQLTGALWNTAKVTALNAEGKPWRQGVDEAWPVPVRRGRSAQGSSLWNRPPHAMKFSAGQGKTDFVLVVLHMKADYNGDFEAHRGQEAEVLVEALPKIKERMSDKDIVLIGDTNQVGDHEPASRTFEKAGLTDLNPGTTRTNWRSGAMDRAYVPKDRPAFATTTLVSASGAFKKSKGWDDREFKRRLSDHFLIVAKVGVVADDD